MPIYPLFWCLILNSLIWCSFQASSQEGASKVYELLQGKAFRSIGWRTLFDCLSIYDEKFKQSLQTGGALLPDFQEGDAKALVAYLNVLQKVWHLSLHSCSIYHPFWDYFFYQYFSVCRCLYIADCFFCGWFICFMLFNSYCIQIWGLSG